MPITAPVDSSGRIAPALRTYGLATASVAGTLLLTVWLDHPGIRDTLFIPAILLSTWYGGLGPGLLAVGLSVVGIDAFLVETRFALWPSSLLDALDIAAFSASALCVVWLTASQRRGAGHLREAHDALSARVRQLGAANEQLQTETADRERAEAEVLKQASLLDLTHDTIFVRDMADVITYWNRGAEELYGWSAREARGRVTHELMHTVFPAPLEEIAAELGRTGRWEGELVHTKRNGAQVVVASRWSLQSDEQGKPVSVLETNNDITERKRAEEALQRQANLLEQTHDAVIVWEFPGTIIFWNTGAQQLYGFSSREAIGRFTHDLLHTEHPVPTLEFEAMLESTGAWSGQLTHSTRDGRALMVDSRHVLVREPDGRRFVLETNRDITEQLRAADALRDSQAELARVTRVTMLGEITASIAHEINQPLAAVVMSGNACRRWLDAQPPEIDEARRAVKQIVDDGNRASDVIRRIRSLLQRQLPEKAWLNVNDVIQESLALTQSELVRRGVRIRTQLHERLPAVGGDRVGLQQVLVNLILNAADAMAEAEESARLLTVRTHEGDGVVVDVEDGGKGLDAEQHKRMFEAFYSTKPGGLGMGLSISRSIVEAHRGRLWATPNDGAGTTFHFSLPVEGGGAP